MVDCQQDTAQLIRKPLRPQTWSNTPHPTLCSCETGGEEHTKDQRMMFAAVLQTLPSPLSGFRTDHSTRSHIRCVLLCVHAQGFIPANADLNGRTHVW